MIYDRHSLHRSILNTRTLGTQHSAFGATVLSAPCTVALLVTCPAIFSSSSVRDRDGTATQTQTRTRTRTSLRFSKHERGLRFTIHGSRFTIHSSQLRYLRSGMRCRHRSLLACQAPRTFITSLSHFFIFCFIHLTGNHWHSLLRSVEKR